MGMGVAYDVGGAAGLRVEAQGGEHVPRRHGAVVVIARQAIGQTRVPRAHHLMQRRDDDDEEEVEQYNLGLLRPCAVDGGWWAPCECTSG